MTPRPMTWTQARAACRALGFTLRPTGCDAERALFRVGTRDPLTHAHTYFTSDPEDAAGTAAWIAASWGA